MNANRIETACVPGNEGPGLVGLAREIAVEVFNRVTHGDTHLTPPGGFRPPELFYPDKDGKPGGYLGPISPKTRRLIPNSLPIPWWDINKAPNDS